MKRLIFIIVVILLVVNDLNAQPDSLWSKAYGGEGNDSLWALIATNGGGYLLGGYKTDDISGADCYLVKVAGDGEYEWTLTQGQLYRDEVHDIVQTGDGGYAMTGITVDEGEELRKSLFWRINSEGGTEVWTDFAGEGGYDEGQSIAALPDGDFAITGVHYPGDDWQDDIMLREVEPDGNEDWMNHYGDEDSGEWGLSMVTFGEEPLYLVVAGQKLVYEDEGIDYGSTLLLKTDEDGEQIWLQEFPVEDGLSFPLQLIRTADDGFAMAGGIGYSDPDSGVMNWNAFILKTDDEGEMEWLKEYDLDHDEWGMGLIQLENGGFVMTGAIGDQNDEYMLENCDCFLVRVDREGGVDWTGIYGGENHDFGTTVIKTGDGGYIIGGTTSSIGNGGTDFWLLKTDSDPLYIPQFPESQTPQNFVLYPAYPNPFNSTTTITFGLPITSKMSLNLYDLTGRYSMSLFNGSQIGGIHRVTLNADNLSAGLYIIRLNANQRVFSQKVTLLK